MIYSFNIRHAYDVLMPLYPSRSLSMYVRILHSITANLKLKEALSMKNGPHVTPDTPASSSSSLRLAFQRKKVASSILCPEKESISRSIQYQNSAPPQVYSAVQVCSQDVDNTAFMLPLADSALGNHLERNPDLGVDCQVHLLSLFNADPRRSPYRGRIERADEAEM